MIRRAALTAMALALAATGCNTGNDESDIIKNAEPPPADAPKTAAEYDAKYPVPNAGDAPRKKGGPVVTEP